MEKAGGCANRCVSTFGSVRCAAAVYPMGRPEKPSTALFAMASEDLIHRCGGSPSPCAGKVRRGGGTEEAARRCCPHPPLTRSPFPVRGEGQERGERRKRRRGGAVERRGGGVVLIHRCGGPPSPCAGKVRRGRTGLPSVFAGRRQSDGGSFISRKCSIRGRRFG